MAPLVRRKLIALNASIASPAGPRSGSLIFGGSARYVPQRV